MMMKAEIEVRKQYAVPVDVLLKTPQKYHNTKYF
jgi:hypothetical protein